MNGDQLIAPAVRTRIEDSLARIETEHDVRILLAIESGSRAWGFPSPDSDYDVRFLYARPRDWYLALDPRRDVIELPIVDDLDVGGWDIAKALRLLIKPNAVLLEWLASPITYRSNPDLTATLERLGAKTHGQRSVCYHYLHLGEGQFKRFVDGRDRVALKKYFYVLRPALALRWLRRNPDRLPPMSIDALVDGADLPSGLTGRINRLIAQKRTTKELGKGPRIEAFDELVLAEFATARGGLDQLPPPSGDLWNDANAIFREIVAG